jgi:hypothetical protein
MEAGDTLRACQTIKLQNDDRRHPISAKFVTPTFSDCGEFFRSKSASEIIRICEELVDKIEVLEKVFKVPERLK